MSATFICDACGRQAIGTQVDKGVWAKPQLWWERGSPLSTPMTRICEHACSEECKGRLDNGKRIVAPPKTWMT